MSAAKKGNSRIGGGVPAPLCLLLLVLSLGCREPTEPTRVPDRTPLDLSALTRVTFSGEDDRAPSWSPRGDSIYYTTRGIPPFPAVPAFLLSIPVTGDAPASPVFPALQTGGVRRSEIAPLENQWLTNAVLSPDGERWAYVDLQRVLSPDLCPFVGEIQCSTEVGDHTVPVLDEIVLRVRGRSSGRAREAEPAIRVGLEGREFIPGAGPGYPRFGEWRIVYHPFQQIFLREESAVFRPSWDPEGERVVFSDGLTLRIWEVGADSAPAIPGTEGGVLAAWSPDGTWIAYTRLVAGHPVETSCAHLSPRPQDPLLCAQRRTVHPLEDRRVELVRPDGSEGRVLWDGDEPAWHPDSEHLLFRHDGGLWLGSLGDPGAPRPILAGELEGPREPAVSPTGTLVAFSQVAGVRSYDIWVMPLELEGGGYASR